MLHQGKTLLTKVIFIEETKPIGLVTDEGMWDLTWEWESEGMWEMQTADTACSSVAELIRNVFLSLIK